MRSLGPRGVGSRPSSTVIAGFVIPTSGSVEVDGIPTLQPGPDRGVVFQQYALMPWLTARGNVEFALKRFGLPRDERRRRGVEELERVGLGHASSHYPAELSGGMQQRVGLARTLAGEPKVLLMDEPFGALDAQTRLTMQQLLLDLWETNKITVVFVTHDVDEALVLSDEGVCDGADAGANNYSDRRAHATAAFRRGLWGGAHQAAERNPAPAEALTGRSAREHKATRVAASSRRGDKT